MTSATPKVDAAQAMNVARNAAIAAMDAAEDAWTAAVAVAADAVGTDAWGPAVAAANAARDITYAARATLMEGGWWDTYFATQDRREP